MVKEKSYFARSKAYDGSRVANPAEVLICRNAGIRKDLGALSRSSGLLQRPGLESNLFSLVPRRELFQEVRPVVKTWVTSLTRGWSQVRILPRENVPV